MNELYGRSKHWTHNHSTNCLKHNCSELPSYHDLFNNTSQFITLFTISLYLFIGISTVTYYTDNNASLPYQEDCRSCHHGSISFGKTCSLWSRSYTNDKCVIRKHVYILSLYYWHIQIQS